MKPVKHVLNDIWERYSFVLQNDYKESPSPNIEHYLTNVFAVGPYYYYVLNVTDSTVSNFYEDILSIHGLDDYPRHLKEIIDLIHPDDLAFVMEAVLTSILEPS